jgi:hypothetical protein
MMKLNIEDSIHTTDDEETVFVHRFDTEQVLSQQSILYRTMESQ